MEGETGKDAFVIMTKFKLQIELEVETSQFNSNMVGCVELRQFVVSELQGLNGTEYVAEVKSCEVRVEE